MPSARDRSKRSLDDRNPTKQFHDFNASVLRMACVWSSADRKSKASFDDRWPIVSNARLQTEHLRRSVSLTIVDPPDSSDPHLPDDSNGPFFTITCGSIVDM